MSGLTNVVDVGVNLAGTAPPVGPGAGVDVADLRAPGDDDTGFDTADDVLCARPEPNGEGLAAIGGEVAAVVPLDEVQPAVNSPTSSALTVIVATLIAVAPLRICPPVRSPAVHLSV